MGGAETGRRVDRLLQGENVRAETETDCDLQQFVDTDLPIPGGFIHLEWWCTQEPYFLMARQIKIIIRYAHEVSTLSKVGKIVKLNLDKPPPCNMLALADGEGKPSIKGMLAVLKIVKRSSCQDRGVKVDRLY